MVPDVQVLQIVQWLNVQAPPAQHAHAASGSQDRMLTIKAPPNTAREPMHVRDRIVHNKNGNFHQPHVQLHAYGCRTSYSGILLGGFAGWRAHWDGCTCC